MQLMFYILSAFVLVGAVCTILSVFCGTDLSELLPVYNPRKKKVGATFWGSYNGEFEGEESLALPKISEHPDVYTVGSNKYVKGKPVKSARS